MNTPIRSSVIIALTCVFTTMTQAQDKPRGTPLSAAELHKMFDGGVTLEIHNPAPSDAEGVATYRANGTAEWSWHFTKRSIVPGEDKGTWRIQGDRLCVRWEMHGQRCWRQYRVGDNAYESWRDDEFLNLTFRVRK